MLKNKVGVPNKASDTPSRSQSKQPEGHLPNGAAAETDLEKAERHVALGESHIARQREMVRRLTEAGYPADRAINLLRTFEDLQRQHIAHRDWLRLRSSRGKSEQQGVDA